MLQERNVPPGIPTGWTGSRRSSHRKCVQRKAEERNGSGEWAMFPSSLSFKIKSKEIIIRS